MMTLLRSTTFWAGIAVVIIYSMIAHLVPNRPLQEAIRLMGFALAVGAIARFWSDFMESVRKPLRQLDGTDIMTMAFWLMAVALAGFAGWGGLWRAAGQPSWMQNNDLVGFFLTLLVVSMSLVLIAPGYGTQRPRGRTWVAVCWGLGAALVAYVTAVQPDVRRIVEPLRPYLEEAPPAPPGPLAPMGR